jgi:hypothetical protein
MSLFRAVGRDGFVALFLAMSILLFTVMQGSVGWSPALSMG